jgi:hypothetical protein
MNSTDLTVSRCPTGRLQMMEVSAMDTRLGMVLARSTPWWSVAPAVLGVGPLTDGDLRHPVDHRRFNEAGDHRDLAGFIFIFFSLRLPLTTR